MHIKCEIKLVFFYSKQNIVFVHYESLEGPLLKKKKIFRYNEIT